MKFWFSKNKDTGEFKKKILEFLTSLNKTQAELNHLQPSVTINNKPVNEVIKEYEQQSEIETVQKIEIRIESADTMPHHTLLHVTESKKENYDLHVIIWEGVVSDVTKAFLEQAVRNSLNKIRVYTREGRQLFN